jgi:hypothetical protein
VKIAFDENVPVGMVRVFQTFASEYQLRKITGNFEIKSAKDYAPKRGDPDYVAKNDVPWLKRFAADGGKVVISGNTDMKNVPHERLALIECGFIVVFFEGQWSGWKFFRKCALLLHWWPQIASRIKRAKPGSFYHIPCNWPEKGSLRKVTNEDPKLVRALRKKIARRTRTVSKADGAKSQGSIGPLFEHSNIPVERPDVVSKPQTEKSDHETEA